MIAIASALLTPAFFNIEVALCRNEWNEISLVSRRADRPFVPVVLYGSAKPTPIRISLNWFAKQRCND
jgi:hypothetical protein